LLSAILRKNLKLSVNYAKFGKLSDNKINYLKLSDNSKFSPKLKGVIDNQIFPHDILHILLDNLIYQCYNDKNERRFNYDFRIYRTK